MGSLVDILSADLSMIGLVRILCVYSLSTEIGSGCCRTMTDRTEPVILSPLPRSREAKDVDDPWFEPEFGECSDDYEVPAARNNEEWTCNTDCDCVPCSPYCNTYGWCQEDTGD